jgi:hypothetical protein
MAEAAAPPWQASGYHAADGQSFDPAVEVGFFHAGAPVATAMAVEQARVVVRSSSDAESGDRRDEREYALDGRDIAIGRAPSCDIVLAGDQLASRRHALLRNKGRHYTIVDLGSSNGTYVNDLEIREETVLHDGDWIKVGGHELIYSSGPASPNASHPGAPVSEPAPQSPLLETTPSMASISFAGATPGVGPLEAPEEIQHADEAFVIAQAERPLPEDERGPSEPLGEMAAMPEPQISAAGGVHPAGPTASLDALRAQLAEISVALAAQADAEAHTAEHLRSALSEIRDGVDAVLQTLDAADSDVSDLVFIARQAAENPRHLDYVTTLAAHAGEIADALEARQPVESRGDARAAIEALRDRLNELLA